MTISRDEIQRRIEEIMAIPGEDLRMELCDRYLETLTPGDRLIATVHGMTYANEAMKPAFHVK